MGFKKTKQDKRVKRLSHHEWLDLWLNMRWHEGCPFKTREDRKRAWDAFKHIFEVADCTRPGGWWELEAPGQRLILWTGKTPETGSDYIHREEERELVALVRLGEAKPDEIDKFEKWHRDEFDRSDLEEYLEGKPWVRARYEHEKRLLRK